MATNKEMLVKSIQPTSRNFEILIADANSLMERPGPSGCCTHSSSISSQDRSSSLLLDLIHAIAHNVECIQLRWHHNYGLRLLGNSPTICHEAGWLIHLDLIPPLIVGGPPLTIMYRHTMEGNRSMDPLDDARRSGNCPLPYSAEAKFGSSSSSTYCSSYLSTKTISLLDCLPSLMPSIVMKNRKISVSLAAPKGKKRALGHVLKATKCTFPKQSQCPSKLQ